MIPPQMQATQAAIEQWTSTTNADDTDALDAGGNRAVESGHVGCHRRHAASRPDRGDLSAK
jgi:hypothetical protein